MPVAPGIRHLHRRGPCGKIEGPERLEKSPGWGFSLIHGDFCDISGMGHFDPGVAGTIAIRRVGEADGIAACFGDRRRENGGGFAFISIAIVSIPRIRQRSDPRRFASSFP